MAVTETTARARVKFKSLLGLRTKILPNPGKISNQLEKRIKIKIEAVRGKNFNTCFLSPKTVSIKFNIPSIIASKKPCNRFGISDNLDVISLDIKKSAMIINTDKINVLVKVTLPKANIFSGAKCIFIAFL